MLTEDFSIENWQARRVAQYIQSSELEKSAAKNTLSSKTNIKNKRKDKEFPRQAKVKGIHHHYTSPARRQTPETMTKQVIKWQ